MYQFHKIQDFRKLLLGVDYYTLIVSQVHSFKNI
jgi:hypothetical protein